MEHASLIFSPTALAMFTEAARTMPYHTAEELHEHFLSWTEVGLPPLNDP